MRQPSDLSPFYEYWRLGLESRLAAERWLAAHGDDFALFDNTGPVLPGFYRQTYSGHRFPTLKGQRIPVAIWMTQPVDSTGELSGDEYLVIRIGTWKPFTAETADYQEQSLVMTWEACRRDPVSKEAYDYAMASYAASARFVWADDPVTAAAPQRAVVEIGQSARFF